MIGCDVTVVGQCPVCGKPLIIGPAFMQYWPYCSDPKCKFNHHVWTTEATTCKNEKGKEDE